MKKTYTVIILFLLSLNHTFSAEASLLLKGSTRIEVHDIWFTNKANLKAKFYSGNLSIPWNDVESLFFKEDHILYLDNGTRVVGKSVAQTGDLSFVRLELQDQQELVLERKQIRKIKSLKLFNAEQERIRKEKQARLKQSWSGNVDLGMSLQSGNTEDSKRQK